MQKTRKSAFRPRLDHAGSGFTLMETVIAIGVLAVLLTGFIAVFTPAAQGIRRSISSQQADRLTSTLERELVTLRTGQLTPVPATGFEKGFTWLKEGQTATKAIFVYQYRGNPAAALRADGTMPPVIGITGQPGKDYIIQSMARRAGEMDNGKDSLEEDLKALEGAIFFVKPTQLVFSINGMSLGTPGTIANPSGSTPASADTSAVYADAVIPFSAEFYSVPTKAYSYLTGPAFQARFATVKNPVFTRNLAIRR